jgi:hypothetical protein
MIQRVNELELSIDRAQSELEDLRREYDKYKWMEVCSLIKVAIGRSNVFVAVDSWYGLADQRDA